MGSESCQNITSGSQRIGFFSRQRGQVVVEYVLLLVVGIALAMIILNALAKKDPENPGALIKKWEEIRRQIATDNPGQN